LAALPNRDRRITILCGSGCQYAHIEPFALPGCPEAPIVHTMRGKEYVEGDNPFGVGMTGLSRFSSRYFAMLDWASPCRRSGEPKELVMPPAISLSMAKGFSLFRVQAVLNGRVNEILALARTNLWR
jgi:hypothetical protein